MPDRLSPSGPKSSIDNPSSRSSLMNGTLSEAGKLLKLIMTFAFSRAALGEPRGWSGAPHRGRERESGVKHAQWGGGPPELRETRRPGRLVVHYVLDIFKLHNGEYVRVQEATVG